MVKRPKIYIRDSGVFHALISVSAIEDVVSHPKLGASWEGFALEQVVQHLNLRQEETFFWAVHTGAELDLVFERKGKKWGIEIKYQEAPTLTKSMSSAVSELSLAKLWVVYPGTKNYLLTKNVSAVALKNLGDLNVD